MTDKINGLIKGEPGGGNSPGSGKDGLDEMTTQNYTTRPLGDNLLDLIRVPLLEAETIISDMVCAACSGRLFMYYAGEIKYGIECHICGRLTSEQIIDKRTAEKNELSNRLRKIEIEVERKPKRTAAEVLKELGF